MVKVTVRQRGEFFFDSDQCFWRGIGVNDFRKIIGAGRNDEIILVRSCEHIISNWQRLFLQPGDVIIIRETIKNERT